MKTELEVIESRCGIECSKCPYQESHGCVGCLKIEKPFWGDCPIKSCCESKGQQNCGQCSSFPCQKLKDFAYDKEQGDNGLRIETCKKWCENR